MRKPPKADLNGAAVPCLLHGFFDRPVEHGRGAMRHDDRDEGRHQCGLCGKVLRPYDSISVTDVGERCYRCFNEELADRLGIAFDNTPIAPIVVADADGVRHRFEIRSMLVGTGHAMYAREVGSRDAAGGYRFEILGDLEATPRTCSSSCASESSRGSAFATSRRPSTGGSSRRRTGSEASSSEIARQTVRPRCSS